MKVRVGFGISGASFSMPAECAEGRTAIEATAFAERRTIDPEHFGAMVFYRHTDLPDGVARLARARSPEVDPETLIPRGWDAVRDRCEEYLAAGFSKLVLVPFGEVTSWRTELEAGAEQILRIQT